MANTRQLKKMGATMEKAAGNPKASKAAKAVGKKASAVQGKGFLPDSGKAALKKQTSVTTGQVKQYDKTVKKTK